MNEQRKFPGVRTSDSVRQNSQPGESGPCVYIVDDDPDIRVALGCLFDSIRLRSRAFGSPDEFMASLHPEAEGCLVLDVRLPEASGLELHRKVARSGLELPVVFISGFADVSMSVNAMKLGAVDFLVKPFRDQDLIDAVSAALATNRFQREGQRRVAEVFTRHRSLSDRERQIMSLVTSGLLNKQIAARANLSEATVKVHRGHVMQKMRAASLPDLVRMAEIVAGAQSQH
jgi:FixJ family two-component response regulator